MLKHILIAPIKAGVKDEIVNAKMIEMRSLKDRVPVIENIIVARNESVQGMTNAVTMIIDVKDRVAFNTLLQSTAHHEISATASEAFDTSGFIVSQIEI